MTRRRHHLRSLPLALLTALLMLLPLAVASARTPARGLERIGATDYDLDFTSRNTEIEIRGDFVYVGSFTPLDETSPTSRARSSTSST